MNISDLQKSWDQFGKRDPFWAILTWRQKKGNKWKVDEFFETGVREVDEVIRSVEALEFPLVKHRALDFGAGAGRLSQALAHHFDEVVGVDIAPSMVELARRYNRHEDRCTYFLNASDDLALFVDSSFDFIYSNITLQHMEPGYAKNYIREFLRILTPHGLVVFQLPSEPVSHWRRRLARVSRRIVTMPLNLYRRLRYGYWPIMEGYGVQRHEVLRLLQESAARVVDVQQDNSGGEDWVSYRYYVTKEAQAS